MVPLNTILFWTRTTESLWEFLSIKNIEIMNLRLLLQDSMESDKAAVCFCIGNRWTQLQNIAGSNTNSDILVVVCSNGLFKGFFFFFFTLVTTNHWKKCFTIFAFTSSVLILSFLNHLMSDVSTNGSEETLKYQPMNFQIQWLFLSFHICALGSSLSFLKVAAFWILCLVLLLSLSERFQFSLLAWLLNVSFPLALCPFLLPCSFS